ncbi:MAG: hypothetical protein ABI175_06960 [Polyangiales bacterium]
MPHHSLRITPLFVLASLTGCGGVSSPATPDAASAHDAPRDGTAGAGCNLALPFGNVHAVGGLQTARDEEFISLSPDELTVYVSSDLAAPGTANFDLYAASRPSLTAAFGPLAPLTALVTPSDDRSASISSDGLTLLFHSSRGGNYDLYATSRTSTSAPFPAATALGASINTAGTETSPVLASSGTALYFTRSSATTEELFVATLGATGFGSPVPVTDINAGGSALRVAIAANGLTIYWASARAGGAGQQDIWTASRATPQDAFSGIRNVAELATPLQEFPDALSVDGCRLYFTSDRAGGAGGFDVYVAERPTVQ